MGSTATYNVTDMRVTFPKGKVAEKNPDRAATVHGAFRNVDEKGHPVGDPLSFSSKEITNEMVASGLVQIDIANGILVLPAGERGRRASIGEDQSAVDALLASLTASDEDASEDAPEADAS